MSEHADYCRGYCDSEPDFAGQECPKCGAVPCQVEWPGDGSYTCNRCHAFEAAVREASRERISLAELVARRMGDDGSRTTTQKGRTLDGEARRACAVPERRGDGSGSVRWLFPDDSAITVVGGIWDIGCIDCWCWEGSDHGCDAEEGRPLGCARVSEE